MWVVGVLLSKQLAMDDSMCLLCLSAGRSPSPCVCAHPVLLPRGGARVQGQLGADQAGVWVEVCVCVSAASRCVGGGVVVQGQLGAAQVGVWVEVWVCVSVSLNVAHAKQGAR